MHFVGTVARRDSRSRTRIEHHFDVERELAAKLRSSERSQRKHLYTSAYDELFKRVPDHPQIMARVSPERRSQRIKRQLRHLAPYLGSTSTFVEVGPGDCALSLAVCPQVNRVIAVDVSNEIVQRNDLPSNFSLLISDGVSIPAQSRSVDLVYSDQLMEHLHADDALDQIKEIHRILKPGAAYYCITPNKLLGPHDVTRYFDCDTPMGFHMVEYSYADLRDIFTNAGFADLRAVLSALNVKMSVPIGLAVAIEKLFLLAPYRIRKTLKRNTVSRPFLNFFLGGRILAKKR